MLFSESWSECSQHLWMFSTFYFWTVVPAQDWFVNVMFLLILQIFIELLFCSSLPSTHWAYCPLIPPLSLSSEPAILMRLKCSLPNGAIISSLYRWRNWDTGRWKKLPKVTPLVGCRTSSVQFSHSVLSDSLQPHGLQHSRPSCPSPNPRVYSNSCPSSQWCHPAISFSVIPFSSCPQSLPASGSFQMSQLFASGAQSIGVSASTSVLPMNFQDWFPLGWTGWISLQSKGLFKSLL